MRREVRPLTPLRVIEGDGRPYLLVWNEGVLRSPAAAASMAHGHGSRRLSASGLLTLYLSRVRRLGAGIAPTDDGAGGYARIESGENRGEGLVPARDLALDMGLSVLEPGRRTYVSLFRPTAPLCNTIVRMLRDRECDLVELAYEDVRLSVSCADDAAFVVIARTEELRAARAIASLGYLPVQAGCYLTLLGCNPERTASMLLGQLTVMQRDSPALVVALSAPRPRRAR